MEAKIATSDDSVLLTRRSTVQAQPQTDTGDWQEVPNSVRMAPPQIKLPAGFTPDPKPAGFSSVLTMKTPVTNPGGAGTDFTIGINVASPANRENFL